MSWRETRDAAAEAVFRKVCAHDAGWLIYTVPCTGVSDGREWVPGEGFWGRVVKRCVRCGVVQDVGSRQSRVGSERSGGDELVENPEGGGGGVSGVQRGGDGVSDADGGAG